ncbi:MAG: hypothetical protein ABEN55_12000 [Bradymonadaceae bacterium]
MADVPQDYDSIEEFVDDYNKPVLVAFIAEYASSQVTKGRMEHAKLKAGTDDLSDILSDVEDAIDGELDDEAVRFFARVKRAVKGKLDDAEKDLRHRLKYDLSDAEQQKLPSKRSTTGGDPPSETEPDTGEDGNVDVEPKTPQPATS